MDSDVPKFWDVKKQRVVEGVEIRKTPTKLADILGTYVWVYSGDPEFGGDVEEMLRGCYKDDKEFISRQSMTICADPSQPVTPKNINGHITWGTAKVVFNKVRRVKEGGDNRIRRPWIESYWEVLLTENYEHEDRDEWLDMEGNAVGVAVVLDDNGCPFMVFDWSLPPGCHSSWSGYYVGKRLVEGKDWRLTHDERGRLGIGRSEVHFAKGGTSKEENEDENEDSEEDEEDNEEENEEENEEDEEDVVSSEVVSEDVGEKRKASNGETGANKRRRA